MKQPKPSKQHQQPKQQTSASRLAVRIDGAALPDDEAKALWERFSAYMEEHKSDFTGFAKSEGFATVEPRYEAGRAVLVIGRGPTT